MAFKLLIKNKFISTVIGTIAIYMGVAFLLALSNFVTYITSNIHSYYDYVTMHYGLFINLIFMTTNSFSNPFGGFVENKLGFNCTIILGFYILFISNLFYVYQRNIWLCYFSSIFLGIGVGISTSLLVKNLTLYMPTKKGLISGGFGIGMILITCIFGFAGDKLINNSGYTLGDDETFYPRFISERTFYYFLIGEIIMPFSLIFGLLLIYEFKPEENIPKVNKDSLLDNKDGKNEAEANEGKEEETNEKNKENEEEQNDKNDINDDNNNNEVKKMMMMMPPPLSGQEIKRRILKVIKTCRYWRIDLVSFLINTAISFMLNTAKTFGSLIGINGNALQFAQILQAFACVLVVPVLAIVADKKGPLLITRIISVLTIVPGFILAGYMENDFAFIGCYVLYTLCMNGLLVGFAPFIMEVYGIQESLFLAGILNGCSKLGDVFTTVSAFIFSLICEKEFDEEGNSLEKPCLKSKYRIMYLGSSIFCIISSILLFIESKDKFNYEDQVPLKQALMIDESENENENGKIIIKEENENRINEEEN